MFRTSLFVLALVSPALLGGHDVTRATAKADRIDKAEVAKNKVVQDLSGYYVCEGQEGPGKTYKGITVITKKNDIYMVQWIIGPGVSFTGVGMQTEDGFTAGWAMPVGEKGTLLRGVNSYRIEAGPKLIGRWAAIPSDGTLRSETLTFLKKFDDE
jgi:hypothetical protein